MNKKLMIKQQIRKGRMMARLKHTYGISSQQAMGTPSFAVSLMTADEIKTFDKPDLRIAGILENKAGADGSKLSQMVAELKAKHLPGMDVTVLVPESSRYVTTRPGSKMKLLRRQRQPLGPGLGKLFKLNRPNVSFVTGISASRFIAHMEQSGMKVTRVSPEIFEAAGGRDADGNFYVVLTTNTDTLPDYKIIHVVKKDGDENQTVAREKRKTDARKAPRKILCDELDDELIIEALTAANKEMLGDQKTGVMEWEDDGGRHTRMFSRIHLLVCLFYYLYVNDLLPDKSDFLGGRQNFRRFCENHLPDELKKGLYSDRYFRTLLNKLQGERPDFRKYIMAPVKPQTEWQKGGVPLAFWYAIYCQAAPLFASVLKK